MRLLQRLQAHRPLAAQCLCATRSKMGDGPFGAVIAARSRASPVRCWRAQRHDRCIFPGSVGVELDCAFRRLQRHGLTQV